MAQLAGLDLLPTAVVALDGEFVVRYANAAAENLLSTGAKSLQGQPFLQLFEERDALERTLVEARTGHWDYSAQNATYGRAGLHVSCVVARVDVPGLALLVELRSIEQQLRLLRE